MPPAFTDKDKVFLLQESNLTQSKSKYRPVCIATGKLRTTRDLFWLCQTENYINIGFELFSHVLPRLTSFSVKFFQASDMTNVFHVANVLDAMETNARKGFETLRKIPNRDE